MVKMSWGSVSQLMSPAMSSTWSMVSAVQSSISATVTWLAHSGRSPSATHSIPSSGSASSMHCWARSSHWSRLSLTRSAAK